MAVKRVTKLVGILSRLGLEKLISGSSLEQHLPDKINPIQGDYSLYERIRIAMEEMGATFVKFGQLLSQRTDLFPEEFIEEMEKLQDTVKAVDIDVNRRLLDELGEEGAGRIESVSPDPIGTASIGQVYSARLTSGETVVLKVRRPGIEELVKEDLQILKKVVGLARKIPDMEAYDPEQLYVAFEASMKEEINYLNEAKTLSRFEQNYRDKDQFVIPHVYINLCTSSLICMDFIQGIKISNLDEVAKIWPDNDAITTAVCDFYFDQILDKGLFHADPHPGNIFVLEGQRICLLDYGLVGDILPDDRQQIALLLFYLVQKDVNKTIKVLERMATSFHITDRKSLEYDIYHLVNEFNAPIETLNVTELIGKLIAVIRKNAIGLPAYMFLILRAISYLDGLVRMLSPGLNLMKFAEPYAQRALKDQLNPKKRIKDMVQDIVEVENTARKLPVLLSDLLARIENDQFVVRTELKDLQDTTQRVDRMVNKVVLAILVGSLVIGSSLVVLADTPPKLNNVPVLGVVGYLISTLLTLWLIIRTRRERKKK